MPRSTAAWRRSVISFLSLGGPYEKLIPMQPSPMAETSRLLLPSLRFCTVAPLKRLSDFEIRFERCGSGSPILPIYCLFLLLGEELLVYREASGYVRESTRKLLP